MVREIKCNDKKEWLAKRRELGCGGTDSSIVLNEHPQGSIYELFQEKRGRLPEREETPLMKWGKNHEPTIRKECKDLFGVPITNPGKYVIQRNDRFPHLFVTLDGMVPEVTKPIAELFELHHMPIPSGQGVLEIKTANAFASDDWDAADWPLHYQIQVQHEMIVADVEWGVCAALIGGWDFRLYPALRSSDFEPILIEKTDEFWELVQSDTPPPVNEGSLEATARAIREIFPEGSVIDLPEEADDWATQYFQALEDIKAADARRLAAWNLITSTIGHHTYARTKLGTRFSWKSQTTKAHEVKESTSRVLRHIKG